MFLYIWYCPSICIALLGLNIYGIDTKNSSEKIFAGVIQNITRVNKVLEELIQNYENLQKIYESQELFETTEHSSKKGNKTQFDMTIKPRADKYPATEMIWSDEKADDSDDIEEKEAKTTLELNTSSNHTKKAKTNKKESVLLILLTSDSSHEIVKKNNSRTDMAFIDTHKKLLDEEKKMKNSIGKKTRFNIEPVYIPKSEKFYSEKYKVFKSVSGTSQKIKEKSKAEEKRLATISTAKSIVMFQGTTTPKVTNSLIIRTRGFGVENKTKLNKEQVEEKEIDENFSFTDKDDTLTKEEFKTNILRKAYGDACLKLVIRKCYKACKQVLVVGCRTQKCKESFKESYDRFSRTGCIQAFIPQYIVKNKVKPMKPPKPESSSESESEENNKNHNNFVKLEAGLSIDTTETDSDKSKEVLKSKKTKKTKDKTKRRSHTLTTENSEFRTSDPANGYLRTFCQIQNTSESDTVVDEPPTKELNILRAKYEKACIKTSRQKCNDACTFSYTEACNAHECKEKRKSLFGKTCKTQCKISFTG